MSSIYLSQFSFPTREREERALGGDYRNRMTAFSSQYPFGVLTEHDGLTLSFEPITLLYGGNGCGKTTALNVMADALGLQRDSVYNRSAFFSSYARLCFASLRQPLPEASRIITSDDVFDYMLNLRTLNEGIDARREDLLEQYWHDRRSEFKLNSIEDYEALKAVNLSKSKTPSKYLKARLMQNVRTQSNGESASFYFIHRIQDGALYLLDEPENSLSPSRQIELAEYIERQARFFGCQFVIATHSPFMLAMKGAIVYDMENAPARVRPWTQLPAMRQTFELFMRHRDAFEQAD